MPRSSLQVRTPGHASAQDPRPIHSALRIPHSALAVVALLIGLQAPDPWPVLDHASQTYQTITTLRSEEHTSELQSLAYLVCRLLLEKKKKKQPYSSNHNKTSQTVQEVAT